MNFGTLLPKHGRCRPDHLALVCGDDRMTFRQLNARVGAKFQRVSDVMIADEFSRKAG